MSHSHLATASSCNCHDITLVIRVHHGDKIQCRPFLRYLPSADDISHCMNQCQFTDHTPQRIHNAIITSSTRQDDIALSFSCNDGAISTSRVCWDASLDLNETRSYVVTSICRLVDIPAHFMEWCDSTPRVFCLIFVLISHSSQILWTPKGRLKNTYQVINLWALKIKPVYKNRIFQCMRRCLEWNFKATLWNTTQNILPIHWQLCISFTVENLRALRLKSSWGILKWSHRGTVVGNLF